MYKFVGIPNITTVSREVVTNCRTDHRADRLESRHIRGWTDYRMERVEECQGRQIGRRNHRFVGIADITTVGQEAVTNSRTNHMADRSEGG